MSTFVQVLPNALGVDEDMEQVAMPVAEQMAVANDEHLLRLTSAKPPPKYATGWGKETYNLLCNADQDRDGYLTNTELWKVMETLPIRIASLQPKPDKATGQINPEVMMTYQDLKNADTDGDGCLEVDELLKVVSDLRKTKKTASRLTKVVCGLSLVILALLGAIAGIVGGVVFSATGALPQARTAATVDLTATGSSGRRLELVCGAHGDGNCTYVPSDPPPPALVDAATGGTIATTEALEAAPLFVAPVLPYDALRKVKMVDVSYRYETGGQMVRTAMRVTTMSLVSRTIVDFQGESGQSVQVVNGTAFYMFIPPGGVRPVSYVVCAADVHCSSLGVASGNLEGVVADAISELRAVGLDAQADHLSRAARRRLWGTAGQWFQETVVDPVCDFVEPFIPDVVVEIIEFGTDAYDRATRAVDDDPRPIPATSANGLGISLHDMLHSVGGARGDNMCPSPWFVISEHSGDVWADWDAGSVETDPNRCPVMATTDVWNSEHRVGIDNGFTLLDAITNERTNVETSQIQSRRPFALMNILDQNDKCPTRTLVAGTPASMREQWRNDDGGYCEMGDGDYGWSCPSENDVMSTPHHLRWSTWDGGSLPPSQRCEVHQCNNWVPCLVRKVPLPPKVLMLRHAMPDYVRPFGLTQLKDLIRAAYDRDYASGALGHRPAMSNWMQNLNPLLTATGATLFDVSLVGSHDTVTYDLSLRVMAGDVASGAMLTACSGLTANAFGWNENDCSAIIGTLQDVLNGISAHDCSRLEVPRLGTQTPFRMPACVIQDQAAAQGITILEQLDAGIRYFDFRVGYRGDDQPMPIPQPGTPGVDIALLLTGAALPVATIGGMADWMGMDVDKDVFGTRDSPGRGWYGVHSTLTKRPAMFYLVQLRAWLDAHPQEVVVLWLTQHGDCQANYGSETQPDAGPFSMSTQAIRDQLWEDITNLFDGLLYDNTVYPDLASTPLSTLIGANQRLIIYMSRAVLLPSNPKYKHFVDCMNSPSSDGIVTSDQYTGMAHPPGDHRGTGGSGGSPYFESIGGGSSFGCADGVLKANSRCNNNEGTGSSKASRFGEGVAHDKFKSISGAASVNEGLLTMILIMGMVDMSGASPLFDVPTNFEWLRDNVWNRPWLSPEWMQSFDDDGNLQQRAALLGAEGSTGDDTRLGLPDLMPHNLYGAWQKTCRDLFKLAGITSQMECPKSLLEFGQFHNYYLQGVYEQTYQTMKAMYETTSLPVESDWTRVRSTDWMDFSNALYVDTIEKDGSIRVGAKALNPLSRFGVSNDWGPAGTEEATYPLTQSVIGANVRRLCSNFMSTKPTPPVGIVPPAGFDKTTVCAGLIAMYDAERTANPNGLRADGSLHLWVDPVKGRQSAPYTCSRDPTNNNWDGWSCQPAAETCYCSNLPGNQITCSSQGVMYCASTQFCSGGTTPATAGNLSAISICHERLPTMRGNAISPRSGPPTYLGVMQAPPGSSVADFVVTVNLDATGDAANRWSAQIGPTPPYYLGGNCNPFIEGTDLAAVQRLVEAHTTCDTNSPGCNGITWEPNNNRFTGRQGTTPVPAPASSGAEYSHIMYSPFHLAAQSSTNNQKVYVNYIDVGMQIFQIRFVSNPSFCVQLDNNDETTLKMQICRSNYNSQKWRFMEMRSGTQSRSNGASGTGRGDTAANAGQIVSELSYIHGRNYDLCLHFDTSTHGGNTLQVSSTCNTPANQFFFY